MGEPNVLLAVRLAHDVRRRQPDVVQGVGDCLLEAAAIGDVELVDELEWEFGLLGAGELAGTLALERLLDVGQDRLAQAGKLPRCQQSREGLVGSVEHVFGVVELDAAVVEVEAEQLLARDPGHLQPRERGERRREAVACLELKLPARISASDSGWSEVEITTERSEP